MFGTKTVECRDFKRSLRLCLSIPFIYRYTWAWIRLSGLRTNSQPIYNSYISWHYLHVQVAKGTRAYLLYNVCTPAPYDKLWLIRYENIWARCVVEMITIAECCVSGISALKSGATNDHQVSHGQEWREMIMMMSCDDDNHDHVIWCDGWWSTWWWCHMIMMIIIMMMMMIMVTWAQWRVELNQSFWRLAQLVCSGKWGFSVLIWPISISREENNYTIPMKTRFASKVLSEEIFGDCTGEEHWALRQCWQLCLFLYSMCFHLYSSLYFHLYFYMHFHFHLYS